MMKKNKLLLAVLAVILLAAVCLGVASCTGGGKTPAADEPTAPVVGTEKRTYTVMLKTGGGKALADVGVYFYTDSTMTELVWFAKTDAEGKVSFTDLESTGYVAVLDKVPEGYQVEPYYPLAGETTEIVLETAMTDGDLANLSYELGDVMMNFSVTDVEGNEWVLSDLLAEKKAVVLNFWYVQCAPCKAEFPYLQEAYEKYSDKLALIAMNPINTDEAEIRSFAQELGLTFPVAACDSNWEKAMQLTAYPTTVVIDRFGTIALIHKGGIDESKVFEDAFEFFTDDSYEQTTVEDIMDLEIKAEGSDSTNPIEVGGTNNFEVTVGPGQTVYYHLYKVTNLTLTVSNTNIYAIYNKTTYPSGSGLSFTVNCPDNYTPTAVVFGNDSDESQTFTVWLNAKPGSFGNPYTLTLDKQFTTSIAAGNDKGVNYMYTAKEDGILTVKCVSASGNKYGYSLTNESTMAQNTLEKNEDGEMVVSVKMKKGQKVRLTMGSTDSVNGYPAITFKSIATFETGLDIEEDTTEKIQYAVTVTDQDMVPISGVFMNLKKAETAAEETSDSTQSIPQQKTGEAGVVSLKLEAGVYDVIITEEDGYKASVTEFQLTPERPFASVKMIEVVVERVTYTVTVTGTEGEPLAGAVVMLGLSLEPVTTDETGTAVFSEVPKGEYTVYITAPEGYSAVAAGYPMDADSTALTVALEKKAASDDSQDPEPDETKEDYVITVVDYDGNALSGISVQILSGGIPVTSPMSTGTDGKITASLEAADYTVALVLDKTQRYYETEKAVLPAGTTSLTIRVADTISGEVEEQWFGDIRFLREGGNYVTMQANVTNYFAFTPERAGIYRFSTSRGSAILSYQGGSTFFVNDMTSSTDYDPATNSFTLDYMTDQVGNVTSIIGVTDAEECIIEVTWIRSSILDENNLPSETYKGTHTPKSFTISKADGRKLGYVDITADSSNMKAVLGSDGYYHLNSATGPLLYINLGPNARYVSMYNMLGHQGYGGTFFGQVFQEESGKRKEEYNTLMDKYIEAIDPTYGVYPLTEDLVYMIQNGGANKGWWDPNNGNYLFSEDPDVNLDIAWMFAVMYVK